MHTAELGASVEGGSAPLNVSFSITASDGATSWMLDFGDGASGEGSSVPGTVTHVYTAPGTLTASAMVHFGDGGTAMANRTITVTASAPAGPLVKHWTGSMDANMVFAYVGEEQVVFDNAHMHPEANGTFLVWYDFHIGPASGDLHIDVEPVSATTVDCDVWVRDPGGAYTGGTNDGDCSETYSLSAPGEGDYVVFVNLFTGAAAQITVDLTTA
jgi:PKD repeat protein